VRRRHRLLTLVALLLLALPGPVAAQCPGNLLANPGFEEGEYKTEGMGTSLSSYLGNGWKPWSILGDQTKNREVEYKVLDARVLGPTTRIHSGLHSQKFFTTYATHTAGFYQRVPVPRGSKVTFSIWVQIYTGERELTVGDDFVSDLENPGEYRVSIGIDPTGAEPAGFGAPPIPNTVWSGTLTEQDTRTHNEQGWEVDSWVQLSVSTIAQADHVTVYTRGQPEYAVKHNDSYWDDACLIAETPPTPTPRPTNTPTDTPIPTDTPLATDTPLPTDTPPPTDTPLPTDTPTPTATPVPEPSAQPADTPSPTAALQPTDVQPLPSATAPGTAGDPTDGPPDSGPPGEAGPGGAGETCALPIYAGVVVLAVAMVAWVRIRRNGT